MLRSVALVFGVYALAFTGCGPKQNSNPPNGHADHEAGNEGPMHGTHKHHGGHHKFDDPEAWAKEFDSPERAAWQKPDEVIASLGLTEDAVVADIGAGTGYFAIRFAKAVPNGKVFANDIEAAMVAYLSRRARRDGVSNLFAVKGSPIDPALPEPVDVAFMCNVFHHIEQPDAFFLPVLRNLKPGGKLVIVDFKPDAPEDAPGPPPEMRISAEDVFAKLEALGFARVEVNTDLLPYQYIAVLTVPGA